jgi:hypothetical protein
MLRRPHKCYKCVRRYEQEYFAVLVTIRHPDIRADPYEVLLPLLTPCMQMFSFKKLRVVIRLSH